MPNGEWVSHDGVLHSLDLNYSTGDVSVMRCRDVDLHVAHQFLLQEGLLYFLVKVTAASICA
jgi:hypothetical protein